MLVRLGRLRRPGKLCSLLLALFVFFTFAWNSEGRQRTIKQLNDVLKPGDEGRPTSKSSFVLSLGSPLVFAPLSFDPAAPRTARHYNVKQRIFRILGLQAARPFIPICLFVILILTLGCVTCDLQAVDFASHHQVL